MRAFSSAAILVLFLTASGVSAPAHAAPGAQGVPTVSPEIQRALTTIGAKNWDAAVDQLTALVEKDEGNAQGWILLGTAFRGRGDWEDALGTFEIACELEPVAANAHFEAARVCAEHELDDDALTHIELAIEAGFTGSARWFQDAAFAELREGERFKAIVPPIKPSSECFVERPRVLHTFYGEEPGDVFGWIARDLGDADGDGTSDFLISAPYSGERGPGGGKIYVYSGKSGELLFEHAGKTGEGLGMGIECAGDVDGDGRMDAIAGAPNLGIGPGTAYVYSGRDGSVLLTLTTGESLDAFGRKVSGGVDFDEDGHDDVLVGAPGVGPNGNASGKALLYSGKDGSILATIEGERAGDAFGASNAVWGDGETKLLAIGAGNAGEGQRGRTYVYRWTDGAPVPFFEMASDETGSTLGGMFVAFPGDMDGDGVSEVYASDWQNAAKGASTGRIYIHSGKTGERLFTLTGDQAGDGFGTCTADVGDVDGDGLADLLVGAWQVREAAPSGGKCTLFSADGLRPIATYTCSESGETFGFDTTGVGDIDGDGGIDFLITGGYSAIAGQRSGRVFVIAGPVPTKGK